MRPQLNHTETEIKKEDFKEESTTPATVSSNAARSKNGYMAQPLFQMAKTLHKYLGFQFKYLGLLQYYYSKLIKQILCNISPVIR